MDHGLFGKTASIVFAAGKGSRMTGYEGNKTLLPLVPSGSVAYQGSRPLLVEVLENLPSGPKGIVVHYRAEEVEAATGEYKVEYIPQPQINGTGGALLAAKAFLEETSADFVIITMGDVPLIRSSSYQRLLKQLNENKLVVLAFEPRDKAQYGLLDVADGRVRGIIEWKYWRFYSPERQKKLRFCNAGVYAAERLTLLRYMVSLAKKPHLVEKQWGDRRVTIEEFFLTDIIELMSRNGVAVGMVSADEQEVMGVDTPQALAFAQQRYAALLHSGSGAGG